MVPDSLYLSFVESKSIPVRPHLQRLNQKIAEQKDQLSTLANTLATENVQLREEIATVHQELEQLKPATITCPKCHGEIPAMEPFCRFCGHHRQVLARRCPICNILLDSATESLLEQRGHVYCPRCGTKTTKANSEVVVVVDSARGGAGLGSVDKTVEEATDPETRSMLMYDYRKDTETESRG